MERRIKKIAPLVPLAPRRKRVAAYARVSSGKDAMLHSLSAQISYYSNMIQKRWDWEFIKVYVDEAVTGTKDSRAGFQEMITDCRNGKIDMVITKSIARFARNTVTLLEVVRELKELNVDVYFEKENIHSLSGDGELMLTILASYAQEESRSVSENCKWRIRNQFKQGELANLRFIFGYRISKGDIQIDPFEAGIVRLIFECYTSGIGCGLIAARLNEAGSTTLNGNEWIAERVADILKNEKYIGDALLQKKFVADHLTKALVRNKGELPQYYAENSHPPIISEEMFKAAQAIMEDRRRQFRSKDSSKNRYPFSSKILCAHCGKFYKRKTTHGKKWWNCSTSLEYGKAVCHTKQIPEDTLLFVTTEVLGLEAFDEAIFTECIAGLRVEEFNRLIYIWNDGHEETRTWQDRSRSESWDASKRQAARDRALERGCSK